MTEGMRKERGKGNRETSSSLPTVEVRVVKRGVGAAHVPHIREVAALAVAVV